MAALHDPQQDSSVEAFLERMRPRLQSLFYRYRIPLQDTEDILQQALLALIYQWDNIRNPEAWLIGTLRKTCLLYWREKRRRLYESVDSTVLEWMAKPTAPDQERDELRHDLESLINRLPERCRSVLLLRYRLGMGSAEVADRMGYRPSSMGKVTNRCLAALSKQMVAAGLLRPEELED